MMSSIRLLIRVLQELIFFDKLRKHVVETTRTSESAMLCLSDILRAAMLIAPNQDAPIRAFAPEVAEDLKVSNIFVSLHPSYGS